MSEHPVSTPKAPESDPFVGIIETARRYLDKNPKLTHGAVLAGCILPLLEYMREEYTSAILALQDRGDGGDDLLDEAKDVVLRLAGVIDLIMAKAGWAANGALVEACPEDTKVAYEAARGLILDWSAKYKAYLEAEPFEDEDEDEGGDEDEDEDKDEPTKEPTHG